MRVYMRNNYIKDIEHVQLAIQITQQSKEICIVPHVYVRHHLGANTLLNKMIEYAALQGKQTR